MPHNTGLATILSRNKNRSKNTNESADPTLKTRKSSTPTDITMPEPELAEKEPTDNVKDRLQSVITKLDGMVADNPELSDISADLSSILDDLPARLKKPNEPESESGMNESDRFFSEISEPYETRAAKPRRSM